MNIPLTRICTGLLLASALAACESNPSASSAARVPQPEIQFVDMQGFDSDLSSALGAPLPKVEVSFYDKITPSALPTRLQTWLSSVEAGGGKVKVTPPKSDIAAKDPFLLMTLISSLWNASKIAKEAATKAQFSSAQGYNAELVLKDDGSGQSVIDKVVFVKREK